jgi:hypothetical protein
MVAPKSPQAILTAGSGSGTAAMLDEAPLRATIQRAVWRSDSTAVANARDERIGLVAQPLNVTRVDRAALGQRANAAPALQSSDGCCLCR